MTARACSSLHLKIRKGILRKCLNRSRNTKIFLLNGTASNQMRTPCLVLCHLGWIWRFNQALIKWPLDTVVVCSHLKHKKHSSLILLQIPALPQAQRWTKLYLNIIKQPKDNYRRWEAVEIPIKSKRNRLIMKALLIKNCINNVLRRKRSHRQLRKIVRTSFLTSRHRI